MIMINLDIDICPQALAIQNALKSWSQDYAWSKYDLNISIFPLLNGRERGLCLVVEKTSRNQKALLISFGECRGSDTLFVQSVITDKFIMNGPRTEHFTEESYYNRDNFGYLDIRSVCKSIESKILEFDRES